MSISPFFHEGAFRIERVPVRTNAELLSAWKTEVAKRYRGKTVIRYRQIAERFIDFLDQRNVSFHALSPQLLANYLAGCLAMCSALGTVQGDLVCKKGLFKPQPNAPKTCGISCASYVPIKVDSYLTAENALERLFEFATNETTLNVTNIFPDVKRRIHDSFQKRRLRESEDARYPRRALTNNEIAALFQACGHPRDRLVVGLMLKTGARHQETLLLPDSPQVRAAWDAERIITVESSPGVKRLGNPHLIIDDQLWSLFVDYYAWKDQRLANARESDRRRSRLLLGKDGSKALGFDGMANLWREAGERAGIRIKPGSDAPLTPHSGRYTFVRLLEEAGFSPFWIARLRGDTQAPEPGLRSAWTYAKRSPEELRAAYLEKFPALPL